MRLHALAVTLATALAAVGCGDDAGPRWIALAEDAAEVRHDPGPRTFTTTTGRTFELIDDAGTRWLRTTIARADWQRRPKLHGGVWVAEVAVRSTGRPPDGSAEERLSAGARPFTASPPDPNTGEWDLTAGGFHAHTRQLVLKLEDDETPPASATLDLHAARTVVRDDHVRVLGRRFSGDGFALWPEQRVERTLDLPAHAALRFATSVEQAVNHGSADATPTTFEVLLDGTPVFETTHARSWEDGIRSHVVPLPPNGRDDATLSFAVHGGLAYAAFLAPTIGPAAIGTHAARPWPETRGDVVLVVADTFRADNLRAYGGSDGLTPFLDELGERARVHRNTWSTSTWTLPAHVSLLGGLYPRQAGIVDRKSALPSACTTVAEHLSARGWRTGAVTDSILVSRTFGFDQGFEWWDEVPRFDIDLTLERVRAFLDGDDGRPTFLFVQSYRTHAPYRVSETTRDTLSGTLELDGTWADWQRVYGEELRRETERDTARFDDAVQRIHDLYRGGAADLDRGMRALWTELAERGLDRTAHVVFTSDHGEAFLEHGVMYHPGAPWEELARVPLLIVGPDVEPAIVAAPSSLIDLPRTLAELAGTRAHRSWLGTSLLDPPQWRPIFVFECRAGGSVAVIDAWRKVMGSEERLGLGDVDAAFDLQRDPFERADTADGTTWPEEIASVHEAVLRDLMEARVAPERIELDDRTRRHLEAVGYTGD